MDRLLPWAADFVSMRLSWMLISSVEAKRATNRRRHTFLPIYDYKFLWCGKIGAGNPCLRQGFKITPIYNLSVLPVLKIVIFYLWDRDLVLAALTEL